MWEADTTLTFNEDGTYELVDSLRSDVGNYDTRREGTRLRLESAGSETCLPGETARRDFSIRDLPGDIGFRLRLELGPDPCQLRDQVVAEFDRLGGGSGLVGSWRRGARLTINDDMTYVLETELGTDSGVFTYDEFDGALNVRTTGGDLCEEGDRDLIELAFDGEESERLLFIVVEPYDRCFVRAGMTQWLLPVEESQ